MDVNLPKDLPMTSIPQVEELAHAYCCLLFGEQLKKNTFLTLVKSLLMPRMHKIVCGWGRVPDPASGVYNACLNHLTFAFTLTSSQTILCFLLLLKSNTSMGLHRYAHAVGYSWRYGASPAIWRTCAWYRSAGSGQDIATRWGSAADEPRPASVKLWPAAAAAVNSRQTSHDFNDFSSAHVVYWRHQTGSHRTRHLDVMWLSAWAF